MSKDDAANPFLERYAKLGEEFDPKSVSVDTALRINTLKVSTEAELKKLLSRLSATLHEIDFLDHGYHYTSAYSLGATPECLFGYYYLQETASQVPAEVLDPKPGETILDMCAAPGSKTTQMAAMMKNKGVLIALDANNPRLPALKNNLERCGVSNCVVYKKDAVYCEDLGLEFDRVLLDAPCSGNFTLEKDWFSKRNLADLKDVVRTQRQLLEAAVAVLKKGGVMVYSTCSLEPEENELNIEWLLGKYENLSLEKIDKKAGVPGLTEVFGESLRKEIALCKRFWPHKTGTQGFFIAKIKKH